MTCTDTRFDWQNGTLEEQCAMFDKLGIKRDSLHSTYTTGTLPLFWQEGQAGEDILNGLIDDVKLCAKYNFKCLVVHLIGDITQVGFERFKKLISIAEQNNVVLAIENLDVNIELLEFLFNNISSPSLRFCFDSGHEHCFNYDGTLEKFGKYLVCLHLHDNAGIEDDHTLNKYGTIDWDNMAKRLASIPHIEDVVLNYELLMNYKSEDDNSETVLKECYKQACDLEKAINKYLNK